MRLDTILAQRRQTLSIEFFPPKTSKGDQNLEETIAQVAGLGPDFCSVTYGAGGSTRGRTREIVTQIQATTRIPAMAHLTCVEATVPQLQGVLDEYHAAGITSILALRGDPPGGAARFTPTPGGLANAGELLELLRSDGRFGCATAAYPEGHPDAGDRRADWDNLIRKFDAGACLGITQCFFDAADYAAMMAHVRQARPDIRVVPGILPVTDFKAVERFCQRCGARVPPVMAAALGPLAEDPVRVRAAGMAFTLQLCRELLEQGAPGLHIYSLNRPMATGELVTALRDSGHLTTPGV